MQITVRLFLSFRSGRFQMQTAAYPEGTTAGHVAAGLAIPEDKVGLVLVNDRQASLAQELADGDVLALFPVIGGGAAEAGAFEGEAVTAFLRAGAEGDLVSWAHQVEASRRFGLSCREAESLIFRAGLLPMRYQRNRHMISTEQQHRLFESQAAVVGCGGLGGYVLEELARLGVGRLTAIDPDVFEEHNVNRQLLSSPSALGTSKAEAARRRVAEINPAVHVRSFQQAFAPERAAALLRGSAVVIDALDTVEARLELAEGCTELGIPLVCGTIAGWFGYVTTLLPGDRTLSRLYGGWSGGRGVEAELGNPAFTPAAVASLQVAEAIKVLLGEGTLLRHRILCVNLLDMEVESIPFDVN